MKIESVDSVGAVGAVDSVGAVGAVGAVGSGRRSWWGDCSLLRVLRALRAPQLLPAGQVAHTWKVVSYA